ncbi:MAG: nucleotidyltransferase family protein [Bacteroidetes bacterium]|nr:nucleotidyltransferase family protein [Bacteroidota bacterium]
MGLSGKEKLRNICQIFGNDNLSIPVLSEQEWIDLFEFTQKQGVLCYLYYSLSQKKSENIIPEDWLRRIKLQLMHFSVGNIKHLQNLEEISLIFKKAQIPVLLLKGSHLAFHVYPSPALRPMGDIDLFVREEYVLKGVDALVASGYQSNYFVFENLKKYNRHLPPFTKAGRRSIEFHWTLIQPKFQTPDTERVTNWLIDEIEEKQFGNGSALVFKPSAIVFQIMLHIGLNDELRSSLKNLLDITVIIQKYQNDIDWDLVSDKIIETSYRRRFALVGWLAKNIVSADIPDHFFQVLNVDLSKEIKEAALNRIIYFSDIDSENVIPILYHANLLQKIVIILKYVFMSPSKMRFKHNLKNNWEVFKYYPKRLFNLTKTYKSDILKTLRANEELMDKTKEEILLRDWLGN